MNEAIGSIYILTNPGMSGFIKIGYADDVEERVRTLNNQESAPFSFQVYATYDVPVRLADKKLHTIIDQLNPELRAVEVKDGKTRRREFYAMSPEAAFDILRAIAELHGFEARLHLWAQTEDAKANEINAEKSAEARNRMEAFRFSLVEIPVGATIQYRYDPSKNAEVVSDRRVRFNGQEYSLSALAQRLSGKEGPLQGPLYFTYEGEVLADRRKRMSEE